MRVVYLVLAGGNKQHELNKISQEKTWATENPNFQVFWIHGDSRIHQTKLVNRDIYVPVEEQYENLLAKTIYALRWLNENHQFDFVIRTNTSNYFNYEKTKMELSKDESYVNKFGGVKATWVGEAASTYSVTEYISGAGIHLSRIAATELCRMIVSDYFLIPDDVAISKYLSDNGIDMFVMNRSNVTDYEPISPLHQTRVKSWVSSKVTSSRMHEVHRIHTAETVVNLFFGLTSHMFREAIRIVSEHRFHAKCVLTKYIIHIPRTMRNFMKIKFNE